MNEVLKWLQGLGAGALWTLWQYVQGAHGGSWWQVAALAVLVRLLGWAVSKLPLGEGA